MTPLIPSRRAYLFASVCAFMGAWDGAESAFSQAVPPIISPAENNGSSRRVNSNLAATAVPHSLSGKHPLVPLNDAYESIQEPSVVQQFEGEASGVLPDINISYPESINLNWQAGIIIKLSTGGSARTSPCRLSVCIPTHLELVNASPQGTQSKAGLLEFDIPAIGSAKPAEIHLDIIAREKKSITLDTSLTIVRNKSVEVAVRQPVLEMELVGSGEGVLGKSHELQIVIKNTGDGVANQLQIESDLSDGCVVDEQALAQLAQAGTLEPGESIRVPLAARLIQDGAQSVGIAAKALGANQVVQKLDLNVFKPTLEISATAPRETWVNSRSWYTLTVNNPSKVVLRNCQVILQVPSLEILTISEDMPFDAERQTLTWEIGELMPGQEATVQLIAIAKAAGPHLINASVSSDSTEPRELAFDTVALTRPNLSVAVSQVELPAPVGLPSNYRVVLDNRGTESADSVAVRIRLPEGWTAEESEHCEFRDGTAVLTFDSVPAGSQETLEFQATGKRSGESIFHASVQHGETCSANSSETTMYLMENKNYRVSEISEPKLIR